MTNLSLRVPYYAQRLNNKWSAYLLFLIWPFFSLVYAIVNFRSSWSKNIVWFFSGFFGFTFVISNEGMDANRYRDYLIELHNSDIKFTEYFLGVYSGKYGRGDYLEPTLRYLISLFSDDYRILFTVFGLVMGYFFSRNIWFLIEESKEPIKVIALPFLIMFVFIVPFWFINGFRFWTASHIFVYGAIQLLYFRNYKTSLACILLSVATHIAFIFPLMILVLYIVSPKNTWIFLIFLLLSIVILRFDLSFFIDLAPDSIKNGDSTFSNYLNEDYFSKRSSEVQDLNWYAKYRQIPIYLYTLLSSIVLLTFRIKMHHNRYWSNLLHFGILLFSAVGIFDVIPSAGRFFSVSYLFIFGALFLLAQNGRIQRKNQWFFLLVVLFIGLPLLMQIRIGMDFMGFGLFASSPLTTWAFENSSVLP